MAIFISFEGGEGSGKSVQSQILGERLNNIGLQTLLIREPGSTPLGKYLREWLKRETSPKEEMSSIAELFVFAAARAEVVQKIIKPALKLPGMVIITDRFADSTTAYQGYGRKLSFDKITQINHVAMQGVKPDLTFILKVNISKAMERLKKRKKKNRYDKFSKNFYIKAQNAFIKIAKQNKRRYFVLDNSNDSKETEKIILNKFFKVLCK